MIERLLAVDPLDRFATTEELVAALDGGGRAPSLASLSLTSRAAVSDTLRSLSSSLRAASAAPQPPPAPEPAPDLASEAAPEAAARHSSGLWSALRILMLLVAGAAYLASRYGGDDPSAEPASL